MNPCKTRWGMLNLARAILAGRETPASIQCMAKGLAEHVLKLDQHIVDTLGDGVPIAWRDRVPKYPAQKKPRRSQRR